MSMLSEQIEEIKACAYAHEASGDAIYRTALTLYQAADTIEALSAKLAAANMERSEAYFGGGWIACEDRLPEEPFGCLVTVIDTNPMTLEDFENILPYHVGYDGNRWNNSDGEQIPFDVVAWQPLPEPYHP